MAKRRKPKFSNFKAADWDKYLRVKKGEDEYEVERPAAPEDKELYNCALMPFGQSVPTGAEAKPFKISTISRAGIKFALACMPTNTWDRFGIKTTPADTVVGPAGWYPATMVITLKSTTRPTTRTTSQLSTRKYYKYATRSGSIPFGRRTVTTTDQAKGTSTTTADEIDYNDVVKALGSEIVTPTTPSGVKIGSKSYRNEIWLPIAAAKAWASTIVNDPGAITTL